MVYSVDLKMFQAICILSKKTGKVKINPRLTRRSNLWSTRLYAYWNIKPGSDHSKYKRLNIMKDDCQLYR